MNTLRQTYVQLITNDWTLLGIDPKELADSAKTVGGRDRIAAARVDDYLNRMVAMQARYVDVPQPVDQALRSTYSSEVNEAGVDRAVARATDIRKHSDSARAAKAAAVGRSAARWTDHRCAWGSSPSARRSWSTGAAPGGATPPGSTKK